VNTLTLTGPLTQSILKELEAETRKHGHLCFWKRDSDGAFYVGCRDMRVLAALQRDADTNFSHNFEYCPYCGGHLRGK
jgi:hypothetical protein